MSRLPLLLVLGIMAVGATQASAQVSDYYRSNPYSYMRPPALSPYLGLALGRNSAVNYFLGVRSEMDRRTNERILGSAIIDTDRRFSQLREGETDLFPTLTGTGHPSAFMNYGSYYNFGRPPPAPTRRGR